MTPPDAAAFAASGACEWRAMIAAHFCLSDHELGIPALDSSPQTAAAQCPSRAKAYACMHGNTRALVVGPFASRPGA